MTLDGRSPYFDFGMCVGNHVRMKSEMGTKKDVIMKKELIFSMLVGVMTLLPMTADAQDLLASKAQTDRSLANVTAISLNSASRAFAAFTNHSIYSDWNNSRVATVKGSMPANFKVDLRGFVMPTPSRKITSRFGPRWGRQHKGLDIKVYVGDTIVSAFDGKVRVVKYDKNGWGYYVLIRHNNGLETLYGHLSKQLVVENQEVKAGQPIGLGGNTGRSTGSHLHFETRLVGTCIDPALMFDFASQDVTGDYYIVRNPIVKN